jgi:predicted dehydrogenase
MEIPSGARYRNSGEILMETSATAVAGMGATVIRRKKETLFIIGLGNAGKRHARNAMEMGLRVIGYDPNVSVKDFYADRTMTIAAGLSELPIGVIVATPPDTHWESARIPLLRGFNCLVEKPLTSIPLSLSGFARNGFEDCQHLSVGYQFRYLPSLRDFRRQLFSGTVVQLLGGNFTFLSSEWCSQTYRADFLLEMSHEFDATRYLYGNPTHMFCSELTRDRFQGSARFGDYAGAPSIDYDFDGSPERKGYIRHAKAITMGQDSLHWKFDKAENEQAYVAELRDFLAVCRGEKEQPECTADDGMWALRMIEAIRKSDKTGKWEAV